MQTQWFGNTAHLLQLAETLRSTATGARLHSATTRITLCDAGCFVRNDARTPAPADVTLFYTQQDPDRIRVHWVNTQITLTFALTTSRPACGADYYATGEITKL